jgi:undecaprenyl-diphosphatase
MTRAWFGSFRGGGFTADARLAWCVVIGTIPVGLAGLLFAGWIEANLRNPVFVAVTLSGFGLLMWLADRFGRRERDEYTIGWRDALLIGGAQALSLMPGTSRSGVTMTVGRSLGLTRDASARFSFLLAVPGIGMAGGYELLQLLQDPENGADWPVMGLGVAVSAVTGYLCIHWLLKVISRIGLAPFALYRFALAALIVYLFA